MRKTNRFSSLKKVRPLSLAIFLIGSLIFLHTVFAVTTNLTSQVIVGNAAPTVSSVVVNAGAPIVLTANATQNVSVTATITDNNGCPDITGGTTTILLYRSGVNSSTCLTAPNDLNCYRATAFTASSTCTTTSVNATTTFAVQYFAQATDSSSSFAAQNWIATVIFKDPANATGSSDATGVELNTLTAINVTTSSINYGTVSANTDTGATDQVATTTNAGNSSTTLQLSAVSTLTSGANSIATSSQHYSTSTFTYPGTSTALTASPVTVTGFLLTAPTSSSNVSQATFWGLSVPGGTATGTYTGTNLFSALFQ